MRYCLGCSKRVGPGHFCKTTLHRMRDDKLFVWSHTTNHWNQYQAADEEKIEARWEGGEIYKAANGDLLWQLSDPA